MGLLKRIENFTDYFITSNGEVFSILVSSRNKLGSMKKLKANIDSTGYLFVNLHKNKKNYKRHIHRLVAEAFIPNPENKSDVNHKNGIRSDNRIENLEWATRSENIQHSYRELGRKPAHTKIILQIKNDVIIAEYCNATEAQNDTGICRKQINNCCRGKQKHSHGYQWKYKE